MNVVFDKIHALWILYIESMFYTLNCNKSENLKEQLLCLSTFQRCLHIFSVLVASWQQARPDTWFSGAGQHGQNVYGLKKPCDKIILALVTSVPWAKECLYNLMPIFIKFWRHATHRSSSKELIHHCNGDSYPMKVNFVSLSESIVHYVLPSSNSFGKDEPEMFLLWAFLFLFIFQKVPPKKMAPFTLSKCTHLRFYKSKFPDMDRRLVQFQAWHNFIKVLWFPTRWTRTI